MTDRRISQAGVAVVQQPSAPERRISQAGVAVVQQPSAPERRISQAGVAVVQKNATFDAATTTTITGTNTATFSHTICTLDNRILLVFTGSEDDTDSTDGVVTGITYGGVVLTKIRHDQINIVGVSCNRIEAWYLVAPATGANNVIVSFTGNVTGGIIAALSYYNINPTSPINANNGTADAVGAAKPFFGDGYLYG